jgi:hypothetical protein
VRTSLLSSEWDQVFPRTLITDKADGRVSARIGALISFIVGRSVAGRTICGFEAALSHRQ